MKNNLTAELMAEFLGTLVLILFGNGVVAMVVLFGTGAPGEIVHGGFTNITLGWGLGVTMGVYLAGRISGAHLNPAVTLALAVFRGFSWAKVLPYSLAQTAGAFVAALLVRWNYSEVLNKLDPGHTIKTQGVFSTLPGNGALPVHEWGALRDQIIGTAILLFLVVAVTDLRNSSPAANLAPVVVGLIVVGIGMAWGTDAGYAINPARDFGPRLASFLTGYHGAFNDQFGNAYWWVPIVGPLVGGVIGVGLYEVLVGRFPPKETTAGDATAASAPPEPLPASVRP